MVIVLRQLYVSMDHVVVGFLYCCVKMFFCNYLIERIVPHNHPKGIVQQTCSFSNKCTISTFDLDLLDFTASLQKDVTIIPFYSC